MTACYALSSATLVLDNSLKYAAGDPDNYFSRTWTFQEFSLPPVIVMLTSSQPSEIPDTRTRYLIQRRFWSTSDHPLQEFKVMWYDSHTDIIRLLLDHPEIIHEYLHAADTRMSYSSSDRFAAIMQTISGVMCFTPEAVESLKMLVVSAIAQMPDRFQGCAIIDNAGWSTEMSGSANSSRILAGKSCPGDKLTLTSLLLLVKGGEVVTEGIKEGRERATSVSLSAIFDPYSAEAETTQLPVRVVLDPTTNIVQRVCVESVNDVPLAHTNSRDSVSSFSEASEQLHVSAQAAALYLGTDRAPVPANMWSFDVG